jgi:arabinogalactan endo-1,4-beta-galactosidase
MQFKLYFLILLIITSCNSNQEEENNFPLPVEKTFYKGMDLSFQMELESYNLPYKDKNNNLVQVLPFVKQNGCNLVRLKIWHSPLDGQNTLAKVKAYALKIKAQQLDFLLDFHYSDYWADPSNQTPPVAWQNLTQEQIRQELYLYTKNVLTELKNQGTMPKMVQIGNETDSGFIWDYGKVWNQFNNNWNNLAQLYVKAIQAVREVGGNDTKIMLHHSSVENSIYYFNELVTYNLDYDIIGVSYYPQFQIKDLNLVQTKLNALASTFQKDIFLVEIAYPFSLGFNDNSTNFIGFANQILPQYPATQNGQKEFMLKMISVVKNIPNERGIGFCYWAPDWVAFSGNQNTSTNGSSWENQCLWDFDLKALPAFEVFE